MPLLLALLLIPLLVIVLIPVSLVVRIRRGTMRRQARRWVVTANTIAVTLSTAMFLIGALITSRWVPEVLGYSLGGLGLGAVLGLIGFALTRWESSRGVVHFTPNRWLRPDGDALSSPLRITYGVWRIWAAWQADIETDRRRGCLWNRDVNRGWRGRARLLLVLLDRHPSSSSLFARTLTDASADRFYVLFSLSFSFFYVPLDAGYVKIPARAASSAGFVRCASNPARVAFSLSCSWPNPVNATSKTRLPRTRRIR